MEAQAQAALKRKMILERHKKIIEKVKKKPRMRELLEDDELGPFFLGRGPQALKLLKDVYINVPDPYAYCKPFVIYIWGGTEVYKSREARRWLREVCRLPPEEVWIYMPSKEWKWHNKYERHKAIIIDDFTGGMPQTTLRNVLDGYEIPFEEKNGDVVHCPRVIIITSDRPPTALELKGVDKEGTPIMMDGDEYAQIRRRISHILHFTANGFGFNNTIALERPAVLDYIPPPPPPPSPPPLDDLLGGSPAGLGAFEEGNLGQIRAALGLAGDEGWEALQLDQLGEPEPLGFDLLE